MQTRVRFLRDHTVPVIDSETGGPAGSINFRCGQTYHVPISEAARLISEGLAEDLGIPLPQRDDDGAEVAQSDPKATAAQAELKKATDARAAAQAEEAEPAPPADAASLEAPATTAEPTSTAASSAQGTGASSSPAATLAAAPAAAPKTEEVTRKAKKSPGGEA